MRPDILTASNKLFDYSNIRGNKISIEDIGRGLANTCRYGGQIEEFYSVAQHSVHVSKLVPRGLARLGLMHDAAEAYLGDVVAPLKQFLLDYKRLETRVEDHIFEVFGLVNQFTHMQEVKRADLIALATECRDLRPPPPEGFTYSFDRLGIKPDPEVIVPLGPKAAYKLFMERFEEVFNV